MSVIQHTFSFLRRLGAMTALVGALSGCSQYSNRPGSVAFHNLTAKYNAYYISRNSLNEAEREIYKAYRDDYNQLLPILLPFDSVQAVKVKPQLEDAIKKASIVAERHQNSKWLDNSYTLIGKSRLYLGQWDDGQEALRYVFANGRDEDDKNEALIWLMRAYIARNDFSNALNVSEYLRQQSLTREATRDFYLAKAYLHQQRGEHLTAVAILEQTFPLLKKSLSTARLHYVAGQLYDRIGQYALANEHYRSVSRNRPSYDLAFNASMNSLQNQVLLNPRTDLTSVGFDRMLRDRKNNDLRDRIYYTMGLLAERREQYPQALDYLHRSIAVAGANTQQVPYTYLELARINYDRLDNYEAAKAYYDSALVVLPKEAREYRLVSDRKKALDEFVTQLTIVRTEDSLQQLAQMNPVALDRKIDAIIEAEEEHKQQLLRKAQEALVASNNSAAGAGVPLGAGNERRWELYDPVLVNQGRMEFRRLWGNRPLEDDWRRTTKDNRSFASAGQEALAGPGQPQANPLAASAMTKGSPEWQARREELRRQVPVGDAAIAASMKREEDALYRLGKIYRFDLKESDKAVASFSRLLKDYPKTEYREELYYLLYLSLPEQDKTRSQWKDKLLAEYPGSTYARLLNQTPKASEDGAVTASTAPAKSYDKVYELYVAGNYSEGLAQVENALAQNQGGPLEDKFALLRIFLIGKVQGRDAYLQAINEFIRLYPDSSLLPRVQEMLEVTGQASVRRKF
ncbi:tetratricopeptide repeat protein [Telluribacter sp. SYSU D00476]|uniref:type IX secretion system periplasmic lipoprotein PorW/SprE n=1 Tax=Telluribacter sp. SYSU D00476 TaxID=2811430 RepID=UPI001FF2CDC4|nr:tetratricopeptide repeat protein [Telluribacter sp. SYSU D00476]